MQNVFCVSRLRRETRRRQCMLQVAQNFLVLIFFLIILQSSATLKLSGVSHPKMTDDRELVSRILSGETQAFRLLIRQQERLVAHMVGRLIDQHEDREEICQDVFMKVFEKLGDFNFQSQLSTWIATIAYRQAINHLRKRKVLTADLPSEEIADN